jgi:histidinol-phosphate/aromatic aminotransferase/cobyric acid decarboxylase-like protein
VNGLACAVVPDLVRDADLPGWADAIRAARAELERVLAAHSLVADPSDANYVVVRDARGLRRHLAERAVLVRDTTTFGIADGVRIAVPDRPALDRLDDALKGYR